MRCSFSRLQGFHFRRYKFVLAQMLDIRDRSGMCLDAVDDCLWTFLLYPKPASSLSFGFFAASSQRSDSPPMPPHPQTNCTCRQKNPSAARNTNCAAAPEVSITTTSGAAMRAQGKAAENNISEVIIKILFTYYFDSDS